MPTLVVKRLVTTGYEKQYERTIEHLIDKVEHLDGYMGITIARPYSKENPVYIFTARFDTNRNLQRFKESDVRKECLRVLQTISQAPIKERTIDKLDWLFALPGTHHDIPQYKMVIITILSAYPIVLILNLIINPNQKLDELFLRTLLILVITVVVLSYITLPITMQVFKKWLNSE